MTARATNNAHRKFGFLWSFVEFLITLNAFILIVNILLFLSITNVKEVEEGINPNAEYMAIMTWDNKVDCDVDIWVRNPLGNIIYFSNKDIDHMSIDRDDMGITTDTFSQGANMVTVVDNREYVTFRKMFDGEYVINIHLYACRNENGKIPFGSNIPPFNVHLELIDINPNLRTVFEQDYTIDKIWQEQTAVRFSLDGNGNFIYRGQEYEKLLRVKE